MHEGGEGNPRGVYHAPSSMVIVRVCQPVVMWGGWNSGGHSSSPLGSFPVPQVTGLAGVPRGTVLFPGLRGDAYSVGVDSF